MLLILGAGGQIGRTLAERAGRDAIALDRRACDICDQGSVARAMSAHGIAAVVNCAAYTAVDCAESECERAFAINYEGASIVARAAAARGLPLIHISTDYVYAGTGESAHREDEPVAPVNVYGASKAAGDAAVIAANPAHLLLRVSWVFGVHGSNFVKTMLRLGRERSELPIVDDRVGSPTAASDIAAAILTMAGAACRMGFSAWGVYHYAGAPDATWYAFAQEIFRRAKGPAPHLVPILSRDYPTPAKRPINSTLDCSKVHRNFGILQPDWRRSLSQVLLTIGEART